MTDSYPDSPDFAEQLDAFLNSLPQTTREMDEASCAVDEVPQAELDYNGEVTQKLLLNAVEAGIMLPSILAGFKLGDYVPDLDDLQLDDTVSDTDKELLGPLLELSYAVYFAPVGTPSEPDPFARQFRNAAIVQVLRLDEGLCSHDQKHAYLDFINDHLEAHIPPLTFDNDEEVQVFILSYDISEAEEQEKQVRRQRLASDFGQKLLAEYGDHQDIPIVSSIIQTAGTAALFRLNSTPGAILSPHFVEASIVELESGGDRIFERDEVVALGISRQRLVDLAYQLVKAYENEGVSTFE